MKLLVRLVMVLVACLIAIPLLAVPAQADGPQITIYPVSGPFGQAAYISGSGFNYTTTSYVYIRFYTTDTSYVTLSTATVGGDGSFAIYFTVPECVKGAHPVYASDANGNNITSTTFTVTPALWISSSQGRVNTAVTVTGKGFAAGETGIYLYYDGTQRGSSTTASAYGSWSLTYTIPSSSKGSHSIDAQGAQTTLSEVPAVAFTVTPGIALSKSSGSVGESITVSGSGFGGYEGGITVTYDGTQVGSSTTASSDGSWSIPFSVPASAKGVHKIDASGLLTSASEVAELDFTVSPGMTLVPNSGHVGSQLSVSGTGFGANKKVSVAYDGVEMATGTTDSSGSFSGISFAAPKSIHGNHSVKATDADGPPVSASFTMESVPPPTPTLLSPSQGSRVGFIGNVAPTFEWSAVSDESGVTYNLTLAKSNNFTTPLLSVANLTAASYALTKEQSLAHGTYYWRVRAIDGAQNEGNWTAAYSFKAGLFALWQFVVIIVLVIVLIGVLVYFLRRRQGRSSFTKDIMIH